MKKFLLSVLIICGILFVPFITKADVLPPDKHGVSQCVKIDNSLNNKLGEFYIVGYYEGPMVDGHEAYIVKIEDGSTDNTTDCLYKGYKFNNFNLLAVRKSYLDKVGLKNIDINNPDVYINDDIVLDEKYVPMSDPMKEIVEIYSIDGISNGKLLLDKEKKTTSYSDGTQDKVETFENTNCVLDSCPHLSNFKCVKGSDIDPNTMCTLIYEMGDNCLQYVVCDNSSTCQTQLSEEFIKCKTCVEKCSNAGTDIDQCTSKCSSADVVNQGKNIEPSPSPSPISPSPTPTETKSPIQKLVGTGVSTVIIVISVSAIALVILLYVFSNHKLKNKK